jgi:hypothetical protein
MLTEKRSLAGAVPDCNTLLAELPLISISVTIRVSRFPGRWFGLERRRGVAVIGWVDCRRN